MLNMRMTGIGFDEILRTLPKGGEVKIALQDFPLDELLVTAHETRFTGRLWVRSQQGRDEIRLRRGQIVRVNPRKEVCVSVLRTSILRLALLPESTVDAQISADERFTAQDILDCFVLRQLIDLEGVRKLNYETAKRHILELFNLSEAEVLVESGFEDIEDADCLLLSPLPAIAYGLVVCANAARRNAMLAFASKQFAKLNVSYDSERNRLGLPKTFMAAVQRLSTKGIFFGQQPCLPGLTPEDTAGLLLLFRRMGVLSLGDKIPDVGASITSSDAMDEVTDRLERDFI
jgi:hypothetical protein